MAIKCLRIAWSRVVITVSDFYSAKKMRPKHKTIIVTI